MIDRWFDAFRESPVQAVSDLFSGRAGVGSTLRLDVPELLYQVFPPTLADERTQLDAALLSWLLDMREDYATQVTRLGFSAYGKRIGDALIALQLLDLPHVRSKIRADLDAWLRWLTPLRLAPERDPALECFRLLTRGQPEPGHISTWLRLADDRRSEYLTVALEGLQLLPNHHDAQKNQVLMLQALLRHAVKTHHQAGGARTFFNRRFAALRGLFPRAPQHWNRVLDEALDGFLEHTPLAEPLVDLLRVQRPARLQQPALMPAKQAEWEALLTDILSVGHEPDILAQRLFQLLEQNHRYAEATGVSHYFVRTLHNLGSRFLEHYQLRQDDMTRLGLMIERALVWEPANPYCWMLWADWFQARGFRDAREWTLREMLRLFPDNEHASIELSRLLIDRGEDNRDEAEHWLKQVTRRNPDSDRSMIILAQLLMSRHRKTDAEEMLVKFLMRHPENSSARQALDQLRANILPHDPVYGKNQGDQILPMYGSDAETVPLRGALQELCHRGRLGGEFNRARVARKRGNVTPTNIIREETRKGDPLAGFYLQWLMPEETPECPPHAWAWNACRYWQESAGPAGWQHLAMQFPDAALETEFLRILAASGTAESDSEVTDWYARYDTDGRAVSTAVTFMREALERVSAMSQQERDESALAVLACAAVDAPEFVSEPAA